MASLSKLTKNELIIEGKQRGIVLTMSMKKAEMLELLNDTKPAEAEVAEKGVNGEY